MENIPETAPEGKALRGTIARAAKNWGTAVIVIAVGLGSFALGRMSAGERPLPPIAVDSGAAVGK
jgi:Flp pilus assembly protein protease CpaA